MIDCQKLADDFLYLHKKELAEKAKAAAEKLAAEKLAAEKAEAEKQKEFDEKYPQGETHPDKVEPKKKPKEKPAPKTPAERLKARNAKTMRLAVSQGVKSVFKCDDCGLLIISPEGMVSHLVEIEGYSEEEAIQRVEAIEEPKELEEPEEPEELEEPEEPDEEAEKPASESPGGGLGYEAAISGLMTILFMRLGAEEKIERVIDYLEKKLPDLFARFDLASKATGSNPVGHGTNPKPPGL